jgi:DNA-binding Xre family transcriptional regulator
VPTFDQKLANFLRKRRGELTLERFGRIIGLSKVSVHKLENAKVSARLKTVEQICKRLRCNVSDIFE